MGSNDDASSLGELCQRCGLCCDGSLFSVAPLAPDEVEPLRARGLPLTTRADGAPALAQPCAALADARCTIYADRPASCRRFECLLFSALAEGEVSLDEALEVVGEARERLARGADDLSTFLDRRFRGRARR